MARTKSLLQKVLARSKWPLTPDQAKSILDIGFTKVEKQRYLQLSKKAQEGQLTEREAAELDELLSVDSFLTVLKANALRTLKPKKVA